MLALPRVPWSGREITCEIDIEAAGLNCSDGLGSLKPYLFYNQMSSDSSSSVLAPPRASTPARCVSASPGRKLAHLGGETCPPPEAEKSAAAKRRRHREGRPASAFPELPLEAREPPKTVPMAKPGP